MTLRCTRKLLKALDARGPFAPTPSDTVLGDWYANIHDARPWPLALCLNERSLLAVLVQFRDAQSFISRFRQAALALLTRIGVPSDAVAAERRNLAEIAIAPTANRRLIGCLNEAAFAVSIYFDWA